MQGSKLWNYSDFDLAQFHSDFFALDPNLATALRLADAGGVRRRPSPAKTGMTSPEEGLGGEIGEE